MMQGKIVSDFDGVIGDSLGLALTITRKIVDLFDTREEINSFNDFYRLLGKHSELNNITEIESNTLRELYRIMHRHHSSEIKPFTEVLEVYSHLSQKPLIVSSSYSDTIKTVLEDYQSTFDGIYGYDAGRKQDILERLKTSHSFIYVTDTFRDVMTCKKIDIPVIATCWGYDSVDRIRAENPDYLVHNVIELNELLIELDYIQTKA